MKRLEWTNETPSASALGVYIIFNLWAVEYVGQGVLEDRLQRWPDDDHWWALVPSEAERLGMERFLIDLLEPRQNDTAGANVDEVPVYPPGVPLTEMAARRLLEELPGSN